MCGLQQYCARLKLNSKKALNVNCFADKFWVHVFVIPVDRKITKQGSWPTQCTSAVVEKTAHGQRKFEPDRNHF